MFRRLGALPGRFPIEAAAAVVAGREDSHDSDDATLVATAGLIDKSLLLRDDPVAATRPLYKMLETVRAYSALELGVSGELDDAMEGLARYGSGEAARAAEGLVGADQAPNGWIACMAIWRATAARWRGSSNAAVPPTRPTSPGG